MIRRPSGSKPSVSSCTMCEGPTTAPPDTGQRQSGEWQSSVFGAWQRHPSERTLRILAPGGPVRSPASYTWPCGFGRRGTESARLRARLASLPKTGTTSRRSCSTHPEVIRAPGRPAGRGAPVARAIAGARAYQKPGWTVEGDRRLSSPCRLPDRRSRPGRRGSGRHGCRWVHRLPGEGRVWLARAEIWKLSTA